MSTWREQFGVEPTRDPELIRKWAEFGHDLAIALNDLPADGPCHPATAWIAPSGSVIECEGTGRSVLVDARDYALAGTLAQGWGCTFMVLREAT
jgi:hypothetical protein